MDVGGAGIRLATPGDIPALCALLAELFAIETEFAVDPGRQAAGINLLLADPTRRIVLVAELDGRVAGMIVVQLVASTAQGTLSAWLEDVVVERSARGLGLGRMLTETALGLAKARGASRVQLLADTDNPAAFPFYEKFGFARTRMVCLRKQL